jgi:hypothetical protein
MSVFVLPAQIGREKFICSMHVLLFPLTNRVSHFSKRGEINFLIMKTLIRLLLYLLALALSPLVCFSQDSSPNVSSIYNYHETQDDPYLSNAGGNKITSPGYRFRREAETKQRYANGNITMSSSIFTTQVNVNANGQNILGDAANEPNIVIDPSNPNHLAIGWRQFDNVASNFRQAGLGFSSDAGLSWTFPGVIEPGVFQTDPVLDYNASGLFYYNSEYLNYTCKVYESANYGVSWNSGTDARGGDKQWMAIDRTAGVGNGNIYSSWTPSFSTCNYSFTRSTNANSSYENCTFLDGEPFWVGMAVGISGELYISGGSFYPDSMVVCKSTDAQIAGSIVSWTTSYVYMDGMLVYGPGVNPGGFMGSVDIETDHSTGQGRGNVYVLAALTRISNSDPGDIMFSRSTDAGITWSAPIRINDDISTLNTQWFGTLSAAPNGRIDAVWLDTRDASGGSDSSALYYSYSTDQGNTWSINERMSDRFDPHVGYPAQNKMGDYFDMMSLNQGVHIAWANTLNGEQDVYYSYITPPLGTGEQIIDMHAPVVIYPNPSAGIFTITKNAMHVNIEIYNVMGEIIYSRIMNHSKEDVDIMIQPAGVYFLKTTNAIGSSAITKIIKE